MSSILAPTAAHELVDKRGGRCVGKLGVGVGGRGGSAPLCDCCRGAFEELEEEVDSRRDRASSMSAAPPRSPLCLGLGRRRPPHGGGPTCPAALLRREMRRGRAGPTSEVEDTTTVRTPKRIKKIMSASNYCPTSYVAVSETITPAQKCCNDGEVHNITYHNHNENIPCGL